MLTIYGIPNCDTCRKARKWLDANDVAHAFHDLRADGVSADMLARWSGEVAWNKLLNTRSTTWRSLSDTDKADMNATGAIRLMLEHPTLIKRPVAETDMTVLVGFSENAYAAFKA